MTKGTGKKKIDIKKITSDSARKVTFSKRRTGLFKKAQELETKSGAQVALLVFSPSGRLYTSGDVSLFENNGFSSKSHFSTEIASNSYTKPSTLCLKNFNVEGCTEIFSPACELYSSGEFPIIGDNLNNNGFSSKYHLSTEIASNSYVEPSTLCLKNFNVEGCTGTEIFSPADGLYSSGEFPIFDDNFKNNGFCSKSDPCTDFDSNLFEDWSTLWLESLNVEECSSVDELMLLKEKLEENKEKLVLKMEAEFIESLLV